MEEQSASSSEPAASAKSQEDDVSKVVAVAFSSGDLGDVGRHAVLAALEQPVVSKVRVLSTNLKLLEERDWKCGCGRRHVLSQTDRQRLELIQIDVTDSLAPYLQGVDGVISCLGDRKPFHSDSFAKAGTERIVEAVNQQSVQRLVMLSSVGIAEDWPPMEWSPAGSRMQGFFRTVCWDRYQDLSGAEMAVRQGAENSPRLDFLIVRAVNMEETTKPTGDWHVQKVKNQDHPSDELAKMDCAKYMVRECLRPTMHRTAVVVGGVVVVPT